MKSLRGHFLVASPHLLDENFFRSVVLIVQHDDEGAFGVVLNRPTSTTVSSLEELEATSPTVLAMPIHIGGPVEGPLVAVHGDLSMGEFEITGGVFFSAARETIVALASDGQIPFRLFLGYSGWAPNQLEDEMERGGWLTAPATRDDIFSAYEDLWDRLSHRIGENIISSTIRRGHIPNDPSMN